MAMTAAELEVVVGANTSEAESGLGRVGGLIKGATGGVMGLVGNVLKLGGIAAGGLGAGLIGGGIFSAWNQVSDVEQATVALRAYEKDAGKVDAVLGDLTDYARSDMGVLFNRTDLFGAAQSMKMYGAETDNLSGYTEILSRSVGLGLSDWDTLNTVIGRVGSTGRLTGQDFDYLKAAGFQLDDSLRNQNLTWEELFMHLDQGIPADALAGQADTIRGRLIRLQSAVRNFGMAILGVDADTNTFIEGGLGDMMVKGITRTGELINSLVPVVTALMTSLVSGVQKIIGFVAPGFDFLITVMEKFGANIKTFGAWRGFMYALADAFDQFFGAGSGNKVIKYGLLIEQWMGKAKTALVALWDGIKLVASSLLSFGVAVAGLIGDFINFVQNSENAQLVIESLAVALGVALAAFIAFQTIQSIAGVFKTITSAVLKFNAALLTNPVVLIAAALIALGAAVYFAYKKFEPFRNLVNAVGSAFKSFGKLVGGAVLKGVNKLGKALAPLGKAMGGAVSKGASKLRSGLESVGGYISGKLAVGLPILEGHFRRLAPIVGGQLVSSFNSLKNAVQTAWNFISSVFGSAAIGIFNNIRDAVMSIVGVFQTLGEAIGLAFSGDWSGAFDKLKEAGSQAFDAIIELATLGIRNIMTAFQEIEWGTLWEGLKTAASAAWDSIVDFFTGIDWGAIWSGLQEAASAAWNALVAVASAVWGAIRDFFTNTDWGSIWETMKSAASAAWNTLVDWASAGWEAVKTFFSEVDWGAIWNSMKMAARIAWSTLKDAASNAWRLVKEYFSGISWGAIWTKMKDAAETAWNTLVDWASAGWQKVREFFSGINWGSIWNSMKMAAKIAWHALKGIVEGAWNKVKGFLDNISWEAIWNVMKSVTKAVWNEIVDWIDGKIEGLKSHFADLIDAYNKIPFFEDLPNPFREPSIGAEAATLGALVYAKTLGRLSAPAKQLTDDLETLRDVVNGDAWIPNSDGSITSPGDGSTAVPGPEADPGTPTPVGTPTSTPESNRGGGLLQAFRNIITESGKANVALKDFNGAQAATGLQSILSFGQVDTSARTKLSPLAGLAETVGSGMASSWNQGVNSMAFASNGSMTDVNVTTTTNTNAARSNAISNLATMASAFGSNMNSIASTTQNQMSAASSSTSTQLSAMQLGTATRMALMAATTATQMGAVASTTKTQMSNANSSVATQMAAMQLGVALKMAMMNTTANDNLGKMVSSTKTQTAAMSLAMSLGAAATALKLTSSTAKWSSIVTNAGATAASTARSVGYNIGAGVASGLYSALGSVTAAANAIIGQVDRAMRAKARIKSPSRMTAYLGNMLGEGLAVGMEDMMGMVSKSGLALADAAIQEPAQMPLPAYNTGVSLPHVNQGQANNQGSTTIHVTNHYTVTVDDLDDVKNATDFVKNLKKEYSLAV